MKRPIGVTILAILYMIGGLGILGFQLYVLLYFSEDFHQFDISRIYIFITVGFLGGLTLVAGIGMLRGKQWGWWVGAFSLFYAVARNVNAFIIIPSIAEQYETPATQVMTYYLKHGIRVGMYALLILYFFKKTVVEYFHIGGIKPFKRVMILLIVTMSVFVLLSLPQYVLQIDIATDLLGSGCNDPTYTDEPIRTLVVKVAHQDDIPTTERILTTRFSAFLPSSCATITSYPDAETITFSFEKGAPETDMILFLVQHQGILTAKAKDGTVWFTEEDIADAQVRKAEDQDVLRISLTEEAANNLQRLSSRSVGEMVTLTLDDEALLTASVREPLSEHIMIPLQKDHSHLLAIEEILKHGALPSSVTVLERDL